MAERKSFLLRMDPALLEALQKWASDDLRSLNGQIEFLLRKALKEKGYIVGLLTRTIFYEPGIKDTDWTATDAVKGVDVAEGTGHGAGQSLEIEAALGRVEPVRVQVPEAAGEGREVGAQRWVEVAEPGVDAMPEEAEKVVEAEPADTGQFEL